MAPDQNPNVFAQFLLDKAGHRRKDAAWLAAALADDRSQLALFQGMRPFLLKDGAVGWMAGATRDLLAGPEALTVFLGLDAEGAAHFAVDLPASRDVDDLPIAGLGEFADMRGAAMQLPRSEVAILGCAKSLFEWHARHRFCANCGAASGVAEGGWKRICAACGAEHFPRVDPVAIMLAVHGERCCLGRQKRFPPGMFSALAGFIEPGESIEQGCARELFEEAGLTAASVRYHSTQPWPFPSSLMIGLIAEVSGVETRLDDDEIDEVIWLTKDEARQAMAGGLLKDGRRIFVPPPVAIAHQLVKAWVNEA
jgi:NAD+ diphosphatase